MITMMTYRREKNIWMEFYTTFIKDDINEANRKFQHDGCKYMTANELREENLKWGTRVLDFALSDLERFYAFCADLVEYLPAVPALIAYNPCNDENDEENY